MKVSYPYRGWRIVAALALCTFMVFGASLYAFIVISVPMAHEFQWSAAQTGSLVSAMWLIAPLALIAAPVIERVGAWRVVTIGLALQAVALGAVVLVGAFWQLYLLRIVMGLGKVALMTSAPVIVAQWFSRRFATAIALVWGGMSAGGIILSPMAEHLTSALGWKPTALILAGLMAASIFVVRLLAAVPPATAGEPDATPMTAAPSAGEPAEPARLSWRDVLSVRTGVLVWCVASSGVFSIAVLTLVSPLLEQAGISRAEAAVLLGVAAGGSLLGSSSIGWITDRFGIGSGALAAVVSSGTGMASLALLASMPNLALGGYGALAMGYAIGACEVLWIAVTRQVFGAAMFATMYGAYYFALQFGYAVGGWPSGWTLDHLDRPGVLLFLGLVFLSPGLGWLVMRRVISSR